MNNQLFQYDHFSCLHIVPGCHPVEENATGDFTSLIVQPILPIGLTEDWNLITRPIVPIVSAPKFDVSERRYGDCPPNCNSDDPDDIQSSISSDRETELGDITMWSMVSPVDPPKLPDGSNFIWGLGPSFRFPTATEDQFGSEKWSIGPSNVLLRLAPPEGRFTFGLFQQHHFSIGGEGNRDSVRTSQFQPIYWYKLTDDGAWSIGGMPITTVNWKAGNDNKLTLTADLTINRTMFIGPMPVRFIAGFNFSIVRPEDYGQRWMFKFAVSPVIPRLVREPIFWRPVAIEEIRDLRMVRCRFGWNAPHAAHRKDRRPRAPGRP